MLACLTHFSAFLTNFRRHFGTFIEVISTQILNSRIQLDYLYRHAKYQICSVSKSTLNFCLKIGFKFAWPFAICPFFLLSIPHFALLTFCAVFIIVLIEKGQFVIVMKVVVGKSLFEHCCEQHLDFQWLSQSAFTIFSSSVSASTFFPVSPLYPVCPISFVPFFCILSQDDVLCRIACLPPPSFPLFRRCCCCCCRCCSLTWTLHIKNFFFYHHHHKDREKKKKVEAKCNIFPSSSRSNSQHIFLCRRLRRSRSSSVGNRSKEVKSKRSAITEEKNGKRERRKKDVWRDGGGGGGGGGGGAERVVHLCPSTMQNIERKEKERKKVDFPLFLLHFKKRLFRFFSFFSLSLFFFQHFPNDRY